MAMAQTASSATATTVVKAAAAAAPPFAELSQLHHYVGPQNIPELRNIHSQAQPTAIFYVTTIISLYLIGRV